MAGHGQFVQVGAFVGIFERFTQRQRQHVAQVRQQVVMGGIGYAAVEVEIGLQQVFRGRCGLHAQVGFVNRLDFCVRGMLRSQCCNSRFDDCAHTGQQVEEFILRRTLHHPVQHIRVQQVPFASGLDHRADTRSRVDQPLGDQNPCGFAQYRAADGVLFTEQRFGRQLFVRLETAGYDLHAQFLDNARVHAFSVGRLSIIHESAIGSWQ